MACISSLPPESSSMNTLSAIRFLHWVASLQLIVPRMGGLPLLIMITATAPAISALRALIQKSQAPRSTTATFPWTFLSTVEQASTGEARTAVWLCRGSTDDFPKAALSVA